MTRSRIRVFAAVLLAGALLSAPSVSASGVETDRTAAQTQKFVLIQSDPNESGGPIAANGPIHAHGTDVVIGDFKDRFKFPDGNVVIKHKPTRTAPPSPSTRSPACSRSPSAAPGRRSKVPAPTPTCRATARTGCSARASDVTRTSRPRCSSSGSSRRVH